MRDCRSKGAGDAPVVVQWDPERSVRGAKLDYRSIQVGVGRGIVQRYVNEWTVEIRDLTPLSWTTGPIP